MKALNIVIGILLASSMVACSGSNNDSRETIGVRGDRGQTTNQQGQTNTGTLNTQSSGFNKLSWGNMNASTYQDNVDYFVALEAPQGGYIGDYLGFVTGANEGVFFKGNAYGSNGVIIESYIDIAIQDSLSDSQGQLIYSDYVLERGTIQPLNGTNTIQVYIRYQSNSKPGAIIEIEATYQEGAANTMLTGQIWFNNSQASNGQFPHWGNLGTFQVPACSFLSCN